MIMQEEKRLNALLALEKTNSMKKADLLSAQRAEKQRKQMQLDYRRQQRTPQPPPQPPRASDHNPTRRASMSMHEQT